MIADLLIGIAWILTWPVYWFFKGIDYVVPENVQEGFEYFIGTIANAQGIFPVNTLLQVIMFILTSWLVVYGIRIVFWVLAMIPWVGKKIDLPGGSQTHINQ